MSSELDVIFTGNSAQECNDFIRAVRKHARANKKPWDNHWIAEQVYDAFNGKALRWYSNQAPEVQKDWALLQKALLETWAEDEDNDGSDTRRQSGENPPSAPPAPAYVPIPAAAASSGNVDKSSGKIGRLRIRPVGDSSSASDKWLSNSTYSATGPYSWIRGSFILTSDPESALKVRLKSADKGFCQLEMLAHPSGRKLVAGSFSGPWRDHYGVFVGVDAASGNRLAAQESTYYGGKGNQPFRTMWRLEDKRRLSFVWSENEGEATHFIPIVFGAEDFLLLNYHQTKRRVDTEVELEFDVLIT